MKNFSIMAIILSVGMALATGDAEAARRLGGGKSSGLQRQQSTLVNKSPTATPGQAPASPAAAPAAATGTAAATAAAAPKRSWLGPVAGLAAGLGLAALASHLGFGEELASMLMMGLLAMAVVAVIGVVMRKRALAQNPLAAQAGGMPYAAAAAEPQATGQRGYDLSMPAGAPIASGIGAGVAQPALPAGFDVDGFVRNAKVQFIRLQAANDAGNVDDLREFTTPEMFAELKMELAERGNTTQKTEVQQLDAEVVEVVEESQRYVVSVRFTGQIRTDSEIEVFDECWHLTKPRSGAGGWVLSGIQQVQ